MEFENKTILITGGSSGIGFSAAKKFICQGGRVIFTGRNRDKIEQARKKLTEAGGICEGIIADVSNSDDMKFLFETIKEKYHTVDVVFANAGINGQWSPLEEMPVEQWDKTHAINTRGAFLTLKYGIPLMKEKGGAVIINTSINGTRAFSNRGATAYGSSKAAQATLGKMAALELAPYKIRVNVICPGATLTGIESYTYHVGDDKLTQWTAYPNGFVPIHGNDEWGSADEVAEAVIFLASDKASYITGTELYIDGGTSLIL